MIFKRSCNFCNILGVDITELRDITNLHIQRNNHLASLAIHMEKENKLSQLTRDIIKKIINFPINSNDRIELS